MPISESQKKSMYKYRDKNIKRVPLDMQITEYDRLKTEAAKHGEAINAYIKQAVRERMERDATAPTPEPGE